MEDFLNLNIAALKKKNEKLAEKVARLVVQSDEVIAIVVRGSSHKYTFKIKNAKGAFVLLHSSYNPVRQAKKEIAELNFDLIGIYGVLGFGAGYYVREILKKMDPKSKMLVIENRLDILRKAMELMDLTDIFEDPRFNIVDGTEEELQSVLKNYFLGVLTILTDDLQFFTTPVLKEIEQEKYQEMTKLFFDSLRFTSRIIGNDPGDTLIGLKQVFANLDYLLKSPAITGLKDRYRGKPAICVAAGPSLNKNIAELKKLQNKALVICADTILERLQNEGIVPDIVGVLERGEIVYDSFFKEKVIDPRITLVGQSVISPNIFNNFPGPKLVALKKNAKIEDWIFTLVPDLLSIESGSSVANMNFSIARYLGCDPIILVGQDLAYGEDGTTHARGTIYDGDSLTKKDTKNQAEERILGKNGKWLPTKKWWKVFHYWFEMEIPKTRSKVIDATEGGALIKGTEVMTLREAGDRYCLTEMDSCFADLLAEIDNDIIEKRRRSLCKGIKAELDKLKKADKIIAEALDILEKMQVYFANKKVLDKRLAKSIEEIYKKIDKIIDYKLFFFIAQALIVNSARNTCKIKTIDTANKLNSWLKDKEILFISLKRISQITGEIFEEGLAEIEGLEMRDCHEISVR